MTTTAVAPLIHPDKFYRISELHWQPEVTPQQAAENARRGKGRRRPCAAIPGLLPKMSRATLYRLMATGKLPKPKRLGGGMAVVKGADIIAALDAAIGG